MANSHSRTVARQQMAALEEMAADFADFARNAKRKQEASSNAIEAAKLKEAHRAIARDRLMAALDVLDYEYGRQGRSDPTIAAQFAEVVYGSLLWTAVLNDEREPQKYAGAETLRRLPGVPTCTLAELVKREQSQLPHTNHECGKSCGLKLGIYYAVRGAPARLHDGRKPPFQLAPAYRDDGSALSKEEFVQLDKDRKAAEARDRRRAKGAKPAAQVRAEQAHDRAIWEEYAGEHGIKPDTAQRWAKAGKIPLPEGLIRSGVTDKDRVKKYRGDASPDRRGGGLKAPPPPNAVCPVIKATERAKQIGAAFNKALGVVAELETTTRSRG
jgi:hypothetical protein